LLYTLNIQNKKLKGSVLLPGSKSESNRALIIQQLCTENTTIENLSSAADTQVLKQMLFEYKSGGSNFDVKLAGTAMRFLTAFFASRDCNVILTGSERMKHRPIEILVNALKQIDANIEYTEKLGFPPLKIIGKELQGGKISMDGSVSSQYITALLLISPTLSNGLEIELTGKITSEPYIEMTIQMMAHFGVEVKRNGNILQIKPQLYTAKKYVVESDWSAASYWYSMAALSEEADIGLIGLKSNSLQGDAQVATLFEVFGVETKYNDNLVRISKVSKKLPATFEYDFSDCPDLAQTVAVVVATLNIPSKISGLETLLIKETNRVAALKNELEKLGVEVIIIDNSSIQIMPSQKMDANNVVIETYNDHRMAMAFAPLALIFENLKINNPSVVEKSYPAYWEHLKKIGFSIS
jgi:3-phosphoshikimate 1-carboxyvinyltransferase